MSAQPVPEAVPPPAPCPQCSLPVSAADTRCASCGYALAGVDGRPGPYGRAAGWFAAAALAVVYVLALVIVVLGR